MIEARIVETTKRFTRDLGIDWGFDAIADAAHGNTTGLVFPNNVAADGGVNLPGGRRPTACSTCGSATCSTPSRSTSRSRRPRTRA